MDKDLTANQVAEQAAEEQLVKQRHGLAHVLALAVLELWPETQLAIGPAIDNGLYYDFDFGETKISDSDLAKIEKKMKHILKQNLPFERSELAIDQALAKEQSAGHIYKAELIADLQVAGETKVSYYQLGSLLDLCRGPHVASTKELPDSFKVLKLAGAYWRGSEKNKMLTRIYVLAFGHKAALADYLTKMSEAEKRDHRKLGRDLNLFLTTPEVGLGLVMWQPKGAILWRTLENFWHEKHLANGYELVRTPHIGSRQLWETSGHWGFYNDSMYPPLEVGQSLQDVQAGQKPEQSEEYLLKPMNCPFHVTMFNALPKSYRDLPIRWAECGTVYRYEKSGELSGLTRVRGFTQDDAHIICRREQVKDELKRVADFILYILKTFGFKDFKVYLSVRDKNNTAKYAGDAQGWDFTEKVLEEVAQEQGLDYVKEEGEAAFYGPKLDYKIKDALGREWQCSTLQFDFNLPVRFNMNFVNEQNEKEQPYVLHRALFGSFERFIGLLIEHYAGAFPVWLSPVQVKLVSVGAKHADYCCDLSQKFADLGWRVEVDDGDETVGNKIRKAVAEKAPYILVVGDKEMESDQLTVRDRGSQATREISQADFVKEVARKISERSCD